MKERVRLHLYLQCKGGLYIDQSWGNKYLGLLQYRLLSSKLHQQMDKQMTFFLHTRSGFPLFLPI